MRKKISKSSKSKSNKIDMMEEFNVSPWYSVGKIIPTSNEPKEDAFDSFRPNRQCVDYKISETWTKMQKGDLKVNVKHTVATYEDIPPELCKPQRKKKLKLFSGGPPQWKFIDEIWRKQTIEGQTRLLVEHKKTLRKANAQRKGKRTDDHAVVQSLVGPEWFMELSPKQFAALDQLNRAVFWDLAKRTTTSCEEILANLGLVLRPNKRHISMALHNCCGCPVEFLLVLYQLMNPNRKSYSLNDRLLLSSVVHLSIMPTLRELHVRIPSPPEEPEEPKPEKKKEKKKKYSSPYLEPLTYTPPPPRFSGIYKNKHKQYPENSYFSYIDELKEEKRRKYCIQYPTSCGNGDLAQRTKEYNDAQDFYETLPEVKRRMLELIPPSVQGECPNLLHPRRSAPFVNPKWIAPHLCKVTHSEPMVCFCEENCPKGEKVYKKIKRSCCEKSAQKFLGSICLCDDCLERVRQKHLIRIHGGFQKSPCKCDDPVPIIQGTVENKVCDCYKEYRNRIVGCAARQRLMDDQLKRVLGEVVVTRFGPVYNIISTKGPKICLCNEIIQRKTHFKKSREILLNNEAKFSLGGITMTQQGPVFNLASVVARRPCKCILKYRQQLAVLTIQNKIRTHPICFVNNGLVESKFGPIFHFSGVPGNLVRKPESELRMVCSCEIRKTKCFERCMDYLEYKVANHGPESCTSSEGSGSESGSSVSDEETSTDEESTSTGKEGEVPVCKYCSGRSNGVEKEKGRIEKAPLHSSCPRSRCKKSSSSSSETTSSESEDSESSSASVVRKKCQAILDNADDNETDDDYLKPRPCRCKDELERFMKSKCPCEVCNIKIRQDYARYVRGGTKMTPSGNQISVVQGIQQPLCGCMREHLENIKKIDEYKSRVKARYHLRKQPKKYCICGVKNTPDGPVYIISGIRPPVECECAKAIKEKEEKEAIEKQRAKPPNTGRMKYEISGVKAMPDENIYIIARSLNVKPCGCEKILQKFERVHKSCMDEFDKYVSQTDEETTAFIEEISSGVYRSGLQRSVDISYAQGFENYPSDVFLSNAFTHTPRHSGQDKDNYSGSPNKEEQQEREESPDDEANDKQSEQSQGDGDYKEATNIEESAPESPETSPSPRMINNSGDGLDDKAIEEETSICSSECADDKSTPTESDSDSDECGSCHVDKASDVRPITLSLHKVPPESFLSKRFAIFRNVPNCKKTLMKILKYILEGMAEDGFPLAKLPQVHRLPIFKLWLELRTGTYWSYEDRFAYQGTSKYLWRHTDLCYAHPIRDPLPFTRKEAKTMTWKHAKLIRRVAAEETNNYYRKLKQTTVDTGREFFATTFPYEFPTCTWRDCAFAYLPTKEDDLFPYKIVQPHEARTIPSNKKTNCYC